MKFATTAARILLGLIFLVFGLNHFLHFIPQPAPSGRIAEVMAGFMATGYLMGFVHLTEIVVGVALLVNRFVPLALVVLAPVVANILLFHVFLAPSAIVLPLIALALGVFLAWSYRSAFRPILQANVKPDLSPTSRSHEHAVAH